MASLPYRPERYGPRALLFRVALEAGPDALRRRLALEAALAARPPPGLIEVTPGFTTLLLEFEDARSALAAAEGLDRGILRDPGWFEAPAGRLVEIPVRYDGPDLARVAGHTGLPPGEVARRHAAVEYLVALLGFAPGFPYLLGLDPALHTPRLDSPRTRVPAGSVAIGGGHAGIYPAELPGGWNLIGRTEVALVRGAGEASAKEAFLLAPGDRVRFVPVGEPPVRHA